jgi:hypothetical protein
MLAAAIGGVTAWAATASSDSPGTEAAADSEAAGTVRATPGRHHGGPRGAPRGRRARHHRLGR